MVEAADVTLAHEEELLAAEHFLRELLGQGRAWSASAVTRQAQACGITPGRLQQAAERLGGGISDCPLPGRCLVAHAPR